MQNSSSEYLIRAACLLTRLHEASPSNFKAMLMTVKIFHWLGFIPQASQVYETVEPKYIQFDSLGYLHTAQLAPFSWSQTTVKRWYYPARSFFAQSAKESVDYLAMSYRTGTFSKLQELLDFRDRLMNSLQNHQILVESALLEMLYITGSASSSNFAGIQQLRNLNINPEHRIEAQSLVDNRDLEVIIRWDPIVVNDFDDEAVRARKRLEGLEFVREQSFREQVLLLSIRKALLNLVVAQVNGLTGQLHHGKQYTDDAKEGPSDFVAPLKRLRAEWSELFGSLAEVQSERYVESYLVNQLLSQLHVVTQVPYESFVDSLSAFTLAVIAGESEGGAVTDLGDAVVASMRGLVAKAKSVIDQQQNEASDPFWTYRRSIQAVASTVELLSLSTLVVAVLEKRAVKGKKKSAAPATTTTTSEWARAKQLAIGHVTKCLKEQLVALDALLGE